MTINNPIAIDLGIYIKNIYCNPESNKVLLESLVTGDIHRTICNTIYKLITKDGSAVPIEKISQEEKKKWWDGAKKLADGRLENEKCIELSKALYTLDLLAQQ